MSDFSKSALIGEPTPWRPSPFTAGVSQQPQYPQTTPEVRYKPQTTTEQPPQDYSVPYAAPRPSVVSMMDDRIAKQLHARQNSLARSVQLEKRVESLEGCISELLATVQSNKVELDAADVEKLNSHNAELKDALSQSIEIGRETHAKLAHCVTVDDQEQLAATVANMQKELKKTKKHLKAELGDLVAAQAKLAETTKESDTTDVQALTSTMTNIVDHVHTAQEENRTAHEEIVNTLKAYVDGKDAEAAAKRDDIVAKNGDMQTLVVGQIQKIQMLVQKELSGKSDAATVKQQILDSGKIFSAKFDELREQFEKTDGEWQAETQQTRQFLKTLADNLAKAHNNTESMQSAVQTNVNTITGAKEDIVKLEKTLGQVVDAVQSQMTETARVVDAAVVKVDEVAQGLESKAEAADITELVKTGRALDGKVTDVARLVKTVDTNWQTAANQTREHIKTLADGVAQHQRGIDTLAEAVEGHKAAISRESEAGRAAIHAIETVQDQVTQQAATTDEVRRDIEAMKRETRAAEDEHKARRQTVMDAIDGLTQVQMETKEAVGKITGQVAGVVKSVAGLDRKVEEEIDSRGKMESKLIGLIDDCMTKEDHGYYVADTEDKIQEVRVAAEAANTELRAELADAKARIAALEGDLSDKVQKLSSAILSVTEKSATRAQEMVAVTDKLTGRADAVQAAVKAVDGEVVDVRAQLAHRVAELDERLDAGLADTRQAAVSQIAEAREAAAEQQTRSVAALTEAINGVNARTQTNAAAIADLDTLRERADTVEKAVIGLNSELAKAAAERGAATKALEGAIAGVRDAAEAQAADLSAKIESETTRIKLTVEDNTAEIADLAGKQTSQKSTLAAMVKQLATIDSNMRTNLQNIDDNFANIEGELSESVQEAVRTAGAATKLATEQAEEAERHRNSQRVAVTQEIGDMVGAVQRSVDDSLADLKAETKRMFDGVVTTVGKLKEEVGAATKKAAMAEDMKKLLMSSM